MARQDPKATLPAPWTCQPTNNGLLNALAADFAAHRFSLKHLMRTIARSSAYQLSSRFDGEWKESYTPYFARHYVRQLTAEQLHDAICQAASSTSVLAAARSTCRVRWLRMAIIGSACRRS